MNHKELQTAFVNESPVKYDGAVYQKINAIIYRKKDGHILETAELLDKCGNSIVIVLGKHVETADEDRRGNIEPQNEK